jgi:hypothetical protein
METSSFAVAFQHYQPVSKTISRTLQADPGVIDAMAMNQEDYTEDLRLWAAKSAVAFQQAYGFCQPAEERYTYKCLWNRALQWRRRYARKRVTTVSLENTPGLQDSEALTYEVDFEARLDAIRALRALQLHFNPVEWSTLARVAEAGGELASVHDPATDGTYGAFKMRVQRLRKKAHEILENWFPEE